MALCYQVAINQDALGKEGLRVSKPNVTGGEAWARELSGGAVAVALLNRGASSAAVSVTIIGRGVVLRLLPIIVHCPTLFI